MIKEKISKSRNKIIYISVFIVVFISVIYLKFPNDRLRTWITSQIISNTNLSEVEVSSVRLKPILALELRGVTLKMNPEHTVTVEKALLKPSLISMLTSNISVPFVLNTQDGKVVGKLILSRGNNSIKSLKFTAEHLNVSKLTRIYSPAITDKAIIRGYLNGNFNVDENSQGVFRFNIDQLDLSNIKIGRMKLPDFPDLKSTLTGKINGNNTIIDELSFSNSDISLFVNGSMPPLWRLSHGRIDLYYKLQVKSNKYAYIKSFLRKDEQGNHAGKIGGTLGNPEFVGNSDSPGSKSRNMHQNIDKADVFKHQDKLSL